MRLEDSGLHRPAVRMVRGMKLSIRVKLVSMLIGVGLLPLAAALVTIAVGVKKLQTDMLVDNFEYAAGREADTVRLILAKDIEKLLLTLNDRDMAVGLATTAEELSPDRLSELDEAWPELALDDPRVANVITSPMAENLKRIREEDPRIVEILVTDRFGQLVAATGKAGDFYQADEDWWKAVAEAGRPNVSVPPVNYDFSAAVWSIDLCVPIVSEGELVGVGKAVMDVTRLIAAPTVEAAGFTAAVTIANSDGQIIFADRVEPLSRKISDFTGPLAKMERPGWRRAKGGIIQAYAPVRAPAAIGGLPVVSQPWIYILSVPQSEALAKVFKLSVIVLGAGVLVILIVFLLGLFLVDRIVVRRIYGLRKTARSIAQGDLSRRTGLARTEHWASDEIDELADDFDNMAERVESSHESLVTADQLKMNFIRIAGHELRTPVSYILGTVRLLKDSTDVERLRQALMSMGSKARSLDEIIRAMFKLMPEQPYDQEINCSEVNIADLLEDVYLDCFPFVEQRGQRLLVEGANRVPSIEADRAKLRDVLDNLITNAIKFTPDGGTVKIRVSRQLGDFISFAVQDQGSGIPEGDLPHVFEPFYSGSDVMQHSSGQIGYAKKGMGLGLAIVKHFVELHGGTVKVSSQPYGCVFTITLPITRPERQ